MPTMSCATSCCFSGAWCAGRLRWSPALAVLGALYHFGTRRKEHWAWVWPGAMAATLLWFPATLAFGWYVTRIADYSMFYGSFGAGIATLVWLYLTSFSALLGAELNGVLFQGAQERLSPFPQAARRCALNVCDAVSPTIVTPAVAYMMKGVVRSHTPVYNEASRTA